MIFLTLFVNGIERNFGNIAAKGFAKLRAKAHLCCQFVHSSKCRFLSNLNVCFHVLY